jgi:hypothetical protein
VGVEGQGDRFAIGTRQLASPRQERLVAAVNAIEVANRDGRAAQRASQRGDDVGAAANDVHDRVRS